MKYIQKLSRETARQFSCLTSETARQFSNRKTVPMLKCTGVLIIASRPSLFESSDQRSTAGFPLVLRPIASERLREHAASPALLPLRQENCTGAGSTQYCAPRCLLLHLAHLSRFESLLLNRARGEKGGMRSKLLSCRHGPILRLRGHKITLNPFSH